jgi:hypothetical protein
MKLAISFFILISSISFANEGQEISEKSKQRAIELLHSIKDDKIITIHAISANGKKMVLTLKNGEVIDTQYPDPTEQKSNPK